MKTHNIDKQPSWSWMSERHAIFLRRQSGQTKPWTADPILRVCRFCNVFCELALLPRSRREDVGHQS